MNAPQADPQVAMREALAVWAKIGVLSFGGPAGQIALMHRTLVEERRWISEPRFLHALNFCMLLPGPEAMQLATYSGWLMHGWSSPCFQRYTPPSDRCRSSRRSSSASRRRCWRSWSKR